MKIKMGNNTGNIIRGSVLDCGVAPLARQLRDYDAQLYIKWNASKCEGVGCWEVRRKPEFKTVRPSYDSPRPGVRPNRQGDLYEFDLWTRVLWPKYNETDIVNHVLDCPTLDYRVLPKIQKMDMWKESYRGSNFVNELEYEELKHVEKEEAKANEVREYSIKENRKAFLQFKEFLASGGNPHQLANYWDKV